MKQSATNTSNTLFTFIGATGAILIFALIIFVAYLPNISDPADQHVRDKRQSDADAVRAEGVAKLNRYELIDKDSGIVRIPIDKAKSLTLQAYK
jgi:hypothetical protein